ncbi:MAG: OmpH family outer membrane protein [Micavibrio aeruginosavorus]|uniref:OmpH family outer membrane protein n=1 Tax=Micavibrio aeruginosavorus TaxID=349221 RepID=A0A7T5R0N0_9BACT|nr:MAG: OmpH family outer membrane protein [Micavibrio aeruginosavorus]
MKHLFVSAVVFLALMATPVAVRAEAPDIGVVDVNYIMSESEAAKSLQKQIKEKSEAFQTEFSKFERELKDMEAALGKAKADKVSEEEFKKKRTEFEKKLSDTQALYQKRRQGLEKAKVEAFRALSEAIVKETEKIAAEKGIELVLTKANVVIGSKEMDLTQPVFEAVNANLKDVKLKVSTN